MPTDQIIMGLAAFFVVSAFLTLIVAKAIKSTWNGELIEKKHDPGDDESIDTYKLIFRTTEGKKKGIMVDAKTFESMSIGDKVEKKSGQMLPHKV